MSAGRSRLGAWAGGTPVYENPATYTDPVYTDSPLCAQLFLSHRLSAHGKTPGADPAHGTHTDAMCVWLLQAPAWVHGQIGTQTHKDTRGQHR